MTSAGQCTSRQKDQLWFSSAGGELVLLSVAFGFALGVFVPAWITVFFNPSAVSGPENILCISDFILSMDNTIKEIIERLVKSCFLSHALTWFTPQNLGLSLLSAKNDLSLQYIARIRTQLSVDLRRNILWQKNKPLEAFITPDVAASPCLHTGSREFWISAMNNNMSCERYVGFMKKSLESGRIRDSEDIDQKIRGFNAAAYDKV